MSTAVKIQEASYKIRGHVLQRAVELESLIDIYIAEHFTKDEIKIVELISLLLAPRITLDNKAQVFIYLIDKYNPDFKKANPKYANVLKKIIEERNVFAHYPVDFSDEALAAYERDATIIFVKLKNSSEYKDAEGEKIASLAGNKHIKEDSLNKLLRVMQI
jgi:hypothetical protein